MTKDGKKTVLLGVTGGIAAYKAAYVASGLKKKGYDVRVLMTANATQFIAPLTFETLTGNKCAVDTFDRNFEFSTEHISLAKLADLVLIAPATANVLAKLANGIADDMLTTTVLACTCRKLAAPAMNTAMLENPATQENLRKLAQLPASSAQVPGHHRIVGQEIAGGGDVVIDQSFPARHMAQQAAQLVPRGFMKQQQVILFNP